MKDRKTWLTAWAAVSVLWSLYWLGMSLALGAEAMRDMIAGLAPALLIAGLIVSIPGTLYIAGMLAACIAGCGKAKG